MKGRSPIVLAINSEHFREHADLDSAEREATRLVAERGVLTAVVYVPKRIVRAELVTEHIRGNGRPESQKGPVLTPARSSFTPQPDAVPTGA
jgi:hypothetical protein